MDILSEQKAYHSGNNARYDPFGKRILKEILEAMHYTNIFVRENEMGDGDPTFWDMKGDKNGKTVYFDVSVKTPWEIGDKCPFLKDGIDIVRRKSIDHNPRHSRADYYIEVSNDGKGAFFATKEVFEKAPMIEKMCRNKFTGESGPDKVKRVQVSDGLMVIKKDGKWQKL